MLAATDDRDRMQVHAGVAHPGEHRVRDEPPGDQQAARHRGPVGEPQARHVVEPVQREHQHERARLHDEPRKRHLAREHELRAAAPRLIDAEARKQRKRERRRERHERDVDAVCLDVVETNLRRDGSAADDHRDVEHPRQ